MPQVELIQAAVAPGTVVRARLRLPGAAGPHALRINATRPDGTPADWLDQVVITGDEPADIFVPVAHNDPRGTWTLTATDLYSSQAVSARLEVG